MDGSSSPSSFSDLEAGFSRCNSFSCSSYSKSYGRGSYKAMPHHFLDACTLCRKLLLSNSDIFMYRGDTPFCSEECRQEQIEMDEATEKSRRVSMKRSSAKDQKKSSTINPSQSQDNHARASTAVAG